MAISHIPRSVGHNFAPEYQISAVPYVVDLENAASTTSTFIILSKNGNKGVPDNTVVGEASASDGIVTMGNTAVNLTDVFNDTNASTTIEEAERKANNLTADFEAVEIKVLKLPTISQWIQFIPKAADPAGIIAGFSRTDIHIGNTIHFLDNSAPGDAAAQSMFYPVPLKIRCTNLYFNKDNLKGKLLIGLTSIDRSEFTEVIETFLGDNQ